MSHTYPLKVCLVCDSPYFRGTRNWTQYANSEFCSKKCSGLAQRNTIEKILRLLVVDAKTNCHVWTGHTVGKGYGHVNFGRRMWLVHRLVWNHLKGRIPKGLQLDHLCGNKRCANVEHLRACTARENTLADTSNSMGAKNFRKICCPKCQGPYSTWKNGLRYCKPCRHKAVMEYQREHRDKPRREAKRLIKETS